MAQALTEMKNNRLLIVLLMVFVALAALLAIDDARQTAAVTTPTPGVNAVYVFPDLTLDQIQAIRLRSPETGETFLLNRDADGSWTAPESTGTLDLTEANNIARTMILLPYGETLPLNPGDDKSIYGFTPEGVLSIEIALTDGLSHVVAVGFRTPTSVSYYALVDDRPELYLLERPAVDFLISRLKSPPVS